MSYNRLAAETSPYLLQHKDNPVHWRPWGAEALAEAKRLDRPVLLSVGYAACHWCHVMAHESFEDAETAALMNELFVSIKVDREERPDVDALYMGALHELGEHGGWPLTMFLTPEAEPFWGGTYFPKTPRFGKPSFAQVLREVNRAYKEHRGPLQENAERLKEALQPRQRFGSAPALTEEMIAEMASRFVSAIDPAHGGLRGAPKFPNYNIFAFLWKAGLRYGQEACLQAAEKTLLHICQGGIYDHLGGGFARYSVDERWLVPHFEKMLYDNALLIDLMTEVWKERHSLTHQSHIDLFKMRVAETVGWLLREMVAEGGGFASSLDADSEGEEGKFYVWRQDEIFELLGKEDGEFFCNVYDVTSAGNWEGVNILNRLRALELLDEANEERLQKLRARLFAEREKRFRPGWDDKVLADWNGLTIAALAKAADAFDQPAWLEAARRAYGFVKERMTRDGRLFHAYRSGQAKAPATAADYANMINAALQLYMAADDKALLDDAIHWEDILHRHYWRGGEGGYYFTADDTDDIIIRTLSATDDVTPNANGAMPGALTALYLLTGEARYQQRAGESLAAFAGELLERFVTYTSLVSSAMDHLAPQHIVFAGVKTGGAATAWKNAVRQVSLPGAVVQWLAEGEALPAHSPAAGKTAVDGKAAAYICIGPLCSMPVTEPAAFKNAVVLQRRFAPAKAEIA